ncbi:MAG: TIGR04255 family protein [Oscillospiraceae bacterium]
MFFARNDRYQYTVSPLVEVICQLRFPTILSIGTREPAEFQEAIRSAFPRYVARTERPAPTISGAGTDAPKIEQAPAIMNYNFVSEDGQWKINLTSSFIALSTVRYTRWEAFAQKLDMPLAAFIKTYQPAFFERIGLRYVNAFSRKALGLEGTPWSDLFQPSFLGALAESDVGESDVTQCSLDVEMKLPEDCRMKLHCGPGLLGGGQQDPEVKFILDGDFSSTGNSSAEHIPQKLVTLHDCSTRLLRGALTSELHSAMGPTPL